MPEYQIALKLFHLCNKWSQKVKKKSKLWKHKSRHFKTKLGKSTQSLTRILIIFTLFWFMKDLITQDTTMSIFEIIKEEHTSNSTILKSQKQRLKICKKMLLEKMAQDLHSVCSMLISQIMMSYSSMTLTTKCLMILLMSQTDTHKLSKTISERKSLKKM